MHLNLSQKVFFSLFTSVFLFLVSPQLFVFAASTGDQEECSNQRRAAYESCVNSGAESSAEMEADCLNRSENFYQTCLQIADTPVDKQNEINPLWAYQVNVESLNKIKATSTQGFIGLVVKTSTGIMGTIALIMMVYGGALWMTARGNASQIDQAQNVIFYGAVGIFIIFGSYAIITYIFQAASPTLTQ
jgi:hypothetical protein